MSAPSGPIRVLVVRDPGVAADSVVTRIAADTELSLAAPPVAAGDAPRAVARLQPNVIVALPSAPDRPTIEAIGTIMAESPTPIVVCPITGADAVEATGAAALRAGALAVVPLGTGNEAGGDPLLLSLKNMSQVRVIRRRSVGVTVKAPPPPRPRTRPIELIAIGASTGGPQTLEQVLTRLPARFPIPVTVVQHIDPGFTHSLVEWLRPLCALPVSLAVAGQPVSAPGIYFAPSEHHLVVNRRVFGLLNAAPVSGHRPSASVLFDSVAATYGAGAAGVLLTGMGEDGAAGLKRIADAGGVTVAQDEGTSVVYGMPRAAVALGAAQNVLPPAEIAHLLLGLAAR